MTMSYNGGVAVDWGKRGEYIAKHDMTVAEANEALADPDGIIYGVNPWKSNSTDRRHYREGQQ